MLGWRRWAAFHWAYSRARAAAASARAASPAVGQPAATNRQVADDEGGVVRVVGQQLGLPGGEVQRFARGSVLRDE